MELTENDYRNLFINCVSVCINKENDDNKEKHLDNIVTDGFDWDKDFNEAYNIK